MINNHQLMLLLWNNFNCCTRYTEPGSNRKVLYAPTNTQDTGWHRLHNAYKIRVGTNAEHRNEGFFKMPSTSSITLSLARRFHATRHLRPRKSQKSVKHEAPPATNAPSNPPVTQNIRRTNTHKKNNNHLFTCHFQSVRGHARIRPPVRVCRVPSVPFASHRACVPVSLYDTSECVRILDFTQTLSHA